MEFPKSDISNTKDEPSSPDYLTRLKSLNFTHLYKKGSYLDVYDSTESIWRVAKVIDLSHSSVTIAYDGWKSVYNEVNSMNLKMNLKNFIFMI